MQFNKCFECLRVFSLNKTVLIVVQEIFYSNIVESDNDLSWTEWNSYLIYSNGRNTCLIWSALIRQFKIWQLVDNFTYNIHEAGICMYVCSMRIPFVLTTLRPALCVIFDLSSLIQFNVANAPTLTVPKAFCYLHYIILVSNIFSTQ